MIIIYVALDMSLDMATIDTVDNTLYSKIKTIRNQRKSKMSIFFIGPGIASSALGPTIQLGTETLGMI